jgi:hypothetical protein
MQEHSRYEELCASAAVGQISPTELTELQAHLRECDFCKELQTDFVDINSLWLAQAHKLEPEMYDPQSALRHRILRNLQNAGSKFSKPVRKEILERPKRIGGLGFGSYLSQSPVWAVALLVVGSAVGFGVGSFRHSSTTSQQAIVASTVSSISAPPAAIAKKLPEPAVDASVSLAAKRAATELEQKLAASELEKAQLQNELKEVRQKITDVQDARNRDANELAQLKAAADESRNTATALEAQLRSLKDAQASKDADLVATQFHLHELEGKLADQTAAVERNRALMAVASGSEMRDVIGSRNLHIIDVADVENGGVRKPFGRVFYTQGKSLIFYAYDLSKTKGSQTFYAWGHRDGDPQTPRALGALQNDDPAQGRWVFRFSDTKVLTQIDSVYVTLEPTGKPGDKPKGKKLLNAFLGTPANHP